LLRHAGLCTFSTSRTAARRPATDVIQRGLALAPAPFFFQKGGAMTEVRLRDEDSLERALKLFKRKLQKSGLFGELRRRRHYVKPSEARAIKTAAAERRKRKKKVIKSEW
jgi:small subunit ribosomal protein S21